MINILEVYIFTLHSINHYHVNLYIDSLVTYLITSVPFAFNVISIYVYVDIYVYIYIQYYLEN